MYLYIPFEEALYSSDIGEYTTFGLIVNNKDGREIIRISDVSIDESFVNEICRILNANQLSPIHLHDVIEDVLG